MVGLFELCSLLNKLRLDIFTLFITNDEYTETATERATERATETETETHILLKAITTNSRKHALSVCAQVCEIT